MPDWRLDQLLGRVGIEPGADPIAGRLLGDRGETRITDLTEDSRAVGAGSLFVARRGRRLDGRGFAGAALQAGAAGIVTDDPDLAIAISPRAPAVVVPDVPAALPHLAERFFGAPSRRLSVVGITGTNGKTTVAHGVRTLLETAGVPCGLVGTISVDSGDGQQPSSLTTPMPIELSRALARMVERGLEAVALEVSSHALAQGRTAAIAFDVGVFTNLTRDHLDEHGTMDAYAACKARLFESLEAGASAVINVESDWSERMIASCDASVVRCAMEGRACDARARVLANSLDGTTLRLGGAWGRAIGRTPLIGAHNAMNLLQAASAAHALGADADAIAVGLERIETPRGRLERVEHENGPLVLVDYAHTDDALSHALRAVRSLVGVGAGRVWCVFGCGGDRDRTKRPAMGRVAAQLADLPVLTSDNPRSEDPARIVADVISGLDAASAERVRVELDRESAISGAIRAADERDVVLIAGKGHETEQVLPDGRGGVVRRAFDDREVARAALRARSRLAVRVSARAEAVKP